MKLARLLLCGAALAVAPLLAVPSFLAAQGAPPDGGRRGPPGGDAGNEMVTALKAVKGCLGVETAFTSSRKSVIFAWFEDKAATMRWYESDYHQTMMMGMYDEVGAASSAANGEAGGEAAASAERIPLEHVPDDVPVMCIATITPTTKAAIPGFPMPISQVSIELYTPLPGGLALNGRFTPSGIRVPHQIEATMPLPDEAAKPGDAAKPAAPAPGGGAGSSGG